MLKMALWELLSFFYLLKMKRMVSSWKIESELLSFFCEPEERSNPEESEKDHAGKSFNTIQHCPVLLTNFRISRKLYQPTRWCPLLFVISNKAKDDITAPCSTLPGS